MEQIHSLRSPPQLPETLYPILGAGICDILTRCGAPRIEELRLHAARIATVNCGGKTFSTGLVLTQEELDEIFKRMCGFSLYAHRSTITQGYVTLSGGIRVGICGHAALENGSVIGVNRISGLIIRIPHKIDVNINELLPHLISQEQTPRSMLLYSPPGIGKTTLLAALTRTLSAPPYAISTVVIDTREELGAMLDGCGLCLDVLSGFPRALGMEIAVRNLGAKLLICDEIGNEQDANAILSAANCGVAILASAHASHARELLERPILNRIIQSRVFQTYVGIQRSEDGKFHYRITANTAPCSAH